MFCNLVITDTLSSIICMHNLYDNFVKTLDICNFFSKDLVNSALIPPTGQGMFEGAVSDNFDERIEQKIFHAEIVVDSTNVSAEMKAYQPIPMIVDFKNEVSSDNLKETIEANYKCVKQNILDLVASKMVRIKNDPSLCHLIKE